MFPQPSAARPRVRLAAIVLLCVAGALSACQPKDAAGLTAKAREHRARHELAAAVIELKNAIQQDDKHAAARQLLAEVYLDLGDPVSAEKELRRVLEGDASLPHTKLLLGKALLMRGQFERLLSDVKPDPAGATGGDGPALLALRGHALLGLGQTVAAKAQFEQALARQPDLPDGLRGQAASAANEGQITKANELIQRALAAHPDDVDCLRMQADLQRGAGQMDAALATALRVVALRPYSAQAHIDLANLHIDAGRMPEARAALAAARKAGGPSLAVVYAEAVLQFRDKQPAAALESLQKVLGAAPDYYPAVLMAGAVQASLGATGQAEDHLQKFLAAYPGHLYASKQMSMLYLRAKRSDEALALLRPLVAGHPLDVELLTLAGEANLQAHRFSAAAELFEQASALQPQVSGLHASLALSRLGTGEDLRAVAELERAAALDRGAGRTGILLVMTHLRTGAPEKALAAVLEMERHGDNPLIQNLKGGIYLSQRDPVRARACFDKALRLEPLYMPALANLAELDMRENKGTDARKRYLDALVKSPRNTALLEALARLAMRQGKQSEAISWLERLRKEQPDALGPALRLAELYGQAGQGQQALLLARTIASANPASPEAAATLAQAYVLNHDLAAAADSYTRLAALAPSSAVPLMRLANTRLAMKDHEAALAAVRKALALAPDLLPAQLTFVSILLGQRQYAEALSFATATQQRQPKAAIGFKFEGDILAAQDQQAAALKAYERAFAIAPSGALLVQTHAVLGKLGQQAEADKRMLEWFKGNPDDVPARLYYASSKLVRHDYPAAITQLEALLKIQPDNIVALNDLAWALQRHGDKRALAYAERAYALAPGSPVVIDTLGWILLDSGNPGRALPLLQKASALAPEASEIHFHLGMVLAKSGDKRAARRELEKLLSSSKAFPHREQAAALLASL